MEESRGPIIYCDGRATRFIFVATPYSFQYNKVRVDVLLETFFISQLGWSLQYVNPNIFILMKKCFVFQSFDQRFLIENQSTVRSRCTLSEKRFKCMISQTDHVTLHIRTKVMEPDKHLICWKIFSCRGLAVTRTSTDEFPMVTPISASAKLEVGTDEFLLQYHPTYFPVSIPQRK